MSEQRKNTSSAQDLLRTGDQHAGADPGNTAGAAEARKQSRVARLVRFSVILAIIGLVFVLTFLLAGFNAVTVGLGVFVGIPVLMAATVVYLVAVIRDLKRHDILSD